MFRWLVSSLLWPLLLSSPIALASEQLKARVIPSLGHTREINSVGFSRDGVYLVSASSDKSVKLWDVHTGRLIRTFHGHISEVRAAALSPDNNLIYSTSHDEGVLVWDVRSGRLLRSFGKSDRGTGVMALSPDGRLVALERRKSNAVGIWDTATGKLLRELNGHKADVWSAAFFPDSKHLITASTDQTLKIWMARSGQMMRTIRQPAHIKSVAVSGDGSLIVSASNYPYGDVRLFRARDGAQTQKMGKDSEFVTVSPDGSRILSIHRREASLGDLHPGAELRLWDSGTGSLLLNVDDGVGSPMSRPRPRVVAFSPDGKSFAWAGERTAVSYDLQLRTLDGRVVRQFGEASPKMMFSDFSPDGRYLITSVWAENRAEVQIREAVNGRIVQQFPIAPLVDNNGSAAWFGHGAVSPNGQQLIVGGPKATIYDFSSGHLLHQLDENVPESQKKEDYQRPSYSPDGSRVAAIADRYLVAVWDANSGQFIKMLGPVYDGARSIHAFKFFGGTDRLILGLDDRVEILKLTTGTLDVALNVGSPVMGMDVRRQKDLIALATAGGGVQIWDLETRNIVQTLMPDRAASSVHFSPDGNLLLFVGVDGAPFVWDVQSKRYMHGEPAASNGLFDETNAAYASFFQPSAHFSPDGNLILATIDGVTARLNDARSLDLLAEIFDLGANQWLTMTPKSFFAGTALAAERLSAVKGTDVFSIRQVWDHLYRPDLVEELLKGDPEAKYDAETLNLEKILGSGPAPQIEWFPEMKPERFGNAVKMTIRIVDVGGGISPKVVWRVNGITQGDMVGASAPDASSEQRLVTETLRMDPGKKNTIEVTAYNRAGLLAQVPLRLSLDALGGATSDRRPIMHVLAVGVSKYQRPDWRLRHAASDAIALSSQLKAAATSDGLYDEVRVTSLLDERAVATEIEAAFNKIAADVEPQDVFVLFLAGHGRNLGGKYHFLPHDLTFEGGRSVRSHGISQDSWQRWLAKIVAQKSVLIFDTCESESAVQLRSGNVDRDTAIDRLRDATGRSIITAARHAAYEGYKQHGVLTYAIIEALTTAAGSPQQREVGLLDIAAHVNMRVPELSRQLSSGVPQKPHTKIEGDFPIGTRQAALTTSNDDVIPNDPSHVIVRSTIVRPLPKLDSASEHTLVPGTQVRVVGSPSGDWVVIARSGQKLGYVPVADLAPLQ